jgi:DNA-binding GntR family transcriptional regulator
VRQADTDAGRGQPGELTTEEHESLRDLAIAYGVSHETIRAVLRRVEARATAAALAAD